MDGRRSQRSERVFGESSEQGKGRWSSALAEKRSETCGYSSEAAVFLRGSDKKLRRGWLGRLSEDLA